jgi:hypothetical protein
MTVHYGSARRQHRYVSSGGGGLSPAFSASFLNTNTVPTGFTQSVSNPHTIFASSGLLVVNPTNLFDYDPVTLSSKGWLAETAATNICLQSNFAATWTQYNAGDATSAASTTGPDNGASSGATYTNGSANSTHGTKQTITVTASTTYTFSVLAAWDGLTTPYVYLSINNGSTSFYTVVFNLQTGAIVTSTSGGASFTGGANGITAVNNSTVTASLVTVGWTSTNGFYRPYVTVTTAAGVTSMIVAVGPAGSAAPTYSNGIPTYTAVGESVILYGAQLEANPFPTSLVPTTTASVARGAATLNSSAITWYNSSAGTAICVFDAINFPRATQQNIFSIGTTTTLGMDAAIAANASTTLASFDANATTSLGTITRNTQAKIGVTYDGTTNSGCLNGGTVVAAGTQASITAPTLLRFNYGAGTQAFYGHIKSFQYYASRVTNAQLQTLTT